MSEAHAPFKSVVDGENVQVSPALAGAPTYLLGVCMVATTHLVPQRLPLLPQ